MVENRKLFYAISLMLLTCCQIITMLPHNIASSESSTAQSSSNSTVNNNNNTTENELKDNSSSSSNNSNNKNNNNNDNRDFLIIAAASPRNTDHQQLVTSVGVWEGQENDSRPADNIDDLIFLDKRPINQQLHHHHHHQREKQLQHQQHDQHHHYHHHNLQENENEHRHYDFHHITMDGFNGNSNSNEDTESLNDTTYSTMMVVDDADDDDGEQEPASELEHDDGGIPHEIELQPDINEEVSALNVTPLDLSDFLSLIPATKVKAIVNHYYHNDPEVQRAHAFMSSRDFLMLKQHIIAIPEMSAFLRYLNNSGLDLVQFVTALTNLTAYKSDDEQEEQEYDDTTEALNSTTVASETSATIKKAGELEKATTTIAEMNDIEYVQKQSVTIPPTISNIEIQITTTTPATLITTTAIIDDMNERTTQTAKEQLNGLHGLVDSVLDVLPQDQILATFFDKLEANEQFSKLVDNIGSPEFAKILNNMQNSIPLRNLIFTLHNNGIYVIRIVDSLKSYFFLGGF